MTTTQPPTQQSPSTSHPSPVPAQSNTSSNASPTAPATASEGSQPGLSFPNIQTDQVLAILKGLGPNFYSGAAGAPGTRPGIDPKDSAMAAEALSNMSQTSFGQPLPNYQHYQPIPGMEAGPSSHPRGPPNLTNPLPGGSPTLQAPPSGSATRTEEGQDGEHSDGAGGSQGGDNEKPKSSGGRRNGRSATMSSDEWARQRKDNHKEVERRRRGNINEGINELGRIVPNGSGEKAKGAILSRAVQYIHHLKENEARNIEKWTLEKLLMDQAMGDLQAQLDEVRRLWEDERMARQRLESEVASMRGTHGHGSAASDAPATGSNRTPPTAPPAASATGEAGSGNKPSPKRALEEIERSPSPTNSEKDVEKRIKRQRLE